MYDGALNVVMELNKTISLSTLIKFYHKNVVNQRRRTIFKFPVVVYCNRSLNCEL